MSQKVAFFGECMGQLSLSGEDVHSPYANVSYGGDALNTALYMSRLGVDAHFFTAIGDDRISRWMMRDWVINGVQCDAVEIYKGEACGLYLIEVDKQGERNFRYWRKGSPASKVLDDKRRRSNIFEALDQFKFLYFSGITLAVLSDESREAFIQYVQRFTNRGGEVIFDGNYRASLWDSPEVARDVYEKVYRMATIALPTVEDEIAVFGPSDAQAIVSRLHNSGVEEVVLKLGPNGCLVSRTGGQSESVSTNVLCPMDTTGAGDSFNAAYLAARFQGKDPRQSAESGHRLAAAVIQHHGAIIPPDKMPSDGCLGKVSTGMAC